MKAEAVCTPAARSRGSEVRRVLIVRNDSLQSMMVAEDEVEASDDTALQQKQKAILRSRSRKQTSEAEAESRSCDTNSYK